eukprot:gene7984-10169_t
MFRQSRNGGRRWHRKMIMRTVAGSSWETIEGCPMRVLLIEDEPTTAKAIELMLTTEGFNVYTTDL